MISVDTILLLQQKVESAVQKIEQLKSENDALRAERSELTKALSEKTELLSRFSADEKKIEDGILGALTRLDAVENAIIDSSGGFSNAKAEAKVDPAPAVQAETQAAPVQEQASFTAPVQQEEAAAQSVESREPLVQPMQAEPQAQEQAQNEQTEGGDLFGDTSFETQEESDPDIF